MEGPPKVLDNEKKKIRRGRRESKNVNNSKNTNLTIVGNNTAGLTGKMDSLKRVVQVFSPGVVMLQETKLKKKGTIKLKGFKVFENLRENKEGGGLMSIMHENINPVMIPEDHNEF